MSTRPDEPESQESERAAPPAAAPPTAAAASALEQECAELRASALRAQADYQNLRRRMQSDIDAAVLRAKQPLHRDLLLVLDVLDLALAAPCSGAEAQSLLAGVRMTRSQLSALLEREGLRPVPEGGSFDPALHQAVERVETAEHAPGTVLATLRVGYTLGGQILRPAQVRVAAAPAATDTADTAASS